MRGGLWWWRRHASHLNLSKIYWPWSEPTLADKHANDHQNVSHSNNHIRHTLIVQIMKSIQPSENLINNKFSLIFCQKHILLQNMYYFLIFRLLCLHFIEWRMYHFQSLYTHFFGAKFQTIGYALNAFMAT